MCTEYQTFPHPQPQHRERLPLGAVAKVRRDSKLAKRRAFVWGEGVSTIFAKQASQKKNWAARRRRALRSAGPCCKSTWARSSGARAYVAKGCGEQVHRMPCEGRQHMVQRKAGSGGVLRSVDDNCHGSWSTQNRKLASKSCAPAVPRPRDSRTSRAGATTAAVVLSNLATSGLSFSVSAATSSAERLETLRDSFNEAAIYSSTSGLGLDAERLLTDDVRSARCSWQRWKKFQLCSWRWNIPARSMTPSLLTELTSDRGIDYRASDQRHWEGLEGHALSSGEDFQQWNVEACFAISVRFKGKGGGWEWN